MKIRRFLLAINYLQFINGKQKNRLLSYLTLQNSIELPIKYSQLKGIFKIEYDFQQEYQDALEYAQDFQGDFISIVDQDYPNQLKQIPYPPIILYFSGQLKLLKLASITVVGTRIASPYAISCLNKLLPDVINQNIAIVSGLARGVDALAHQVAILHAGKAIAVIGTGLAHSYPAINAKLQSKISNQGLLLSEYPAEIGPKKWHFPARNRILAGLSSATLVIEAKQRSGSLITANMANEFGRNVLAVPGKLDDLNSVGANQLIEQGAKIIKDSQDILDEIYPFD